MLGIPTVLDRLIQQAIAQELNKIYEHTFSDNSYGFRPNKSAKQAILKAKEYINEGHRWVVDMDLEKFFDKVNHDMLMDRLSKKIRDKRFLKLIRAYLKSGIMINGIKVNSDEGTPQGVPQYKAWEYANTRKGYWRISNSPILNNRYLESLNYKSISKRYQLIHNS